MKNNLGIVFSVLLLLASSACSTDVNANFQGKAPDKNFNTTMRLITDLNLSLIAGTVVSGNPNSLQSGDTICTGATLRVSPAVDSRWAVPNLAIASLYPACSGLTGDYCPAMISSAGVTSDRDVKWIVPATFDNEATFAFNNGFTQDSGHRTILGGVFHNQPVTYNNGTVETPKYWPMKEGGANVFCKGGLEVRDGTTLSGSSILPNVGLVDFTVNTTGTTTHAITTSLSGVTCFAALEKHPQDLANNFYRIYYFGRNLPAIPATTATSTINLNVIDTSGTCIMHTTAIAVSHSVNMSGTSMVRTRVRNDADPIRVYDVTSSNAAFAAMKFPVALGPALGFPTSICPASNGFNETFNNGTDKDLYALVTTSATSGGTVLRYFAETTSSICGNATKCNTTADLTVNGGVTCNIVPPSLTLKPLEVGEFNVTCYDLAGAPVPCIGSNWVSSASLVGTIMKATEKRAEFYSQATPPANGMLTYTSDNGVIDIATCNSSISVVSQITDNTTYKCSFVPPSANMTFSQARYFALNCLANDTIPKTPDEAEYNTMAPLTGTTGNGTVNGVTYTAPATNVTGNLRGIGYFGIRPNVVAAVALAPIRVSNAGGDPYSCSIQPQYGELGPLEIGEFKVTCRNVLNVVVDCIGNAWAWSNISGGFIAAETDNRHAWAYPTSPEGSLGMITYTSGLALCNATVNVTNATFTCLFNPPSTKMDWNKTQYFETHAYKNGTAVTPTRVIYDLIDGLGGTHTSDTVNGTLYGSPEFNSSGRLQGGAELVTGSSFVKGATCLASVIVGKGINNTDPDPDGSSQWCTLFGNGKLYPGYTGWVSIWCGPKANQICNGVVWSGNGASIITWSNNGAYIKVTTLPGMTGKIMAYVGNNQSQNCFLPFTSEEADCADLS